MDKSCRQCHEGSTTFAHGDTGTYRTHALRLPPQRHVYHGWLLDMKSCELSRIHIFLKELQRGARQYLVDNKWIKVLFQI
ncbi:unnamed protein product [Urochloa humidicola]